MAETEPLSPETERRRPEWEGAAPPVPIVPESPLESLREGLTFCGAARLFVAAFDLDFPWLVDRAMGSLPPDIREVRHTALASMPPCGRLARLYGMITAIGGGESGVNGDGPSPVRLRLVPPFRIPERFRLVLENASRRAEDEPVKAYWVPLQAVESGSITVVDPDTVKGDRPVVVFRIQHGSLTISV